MKIKVAAILAGLILLFTLGTAVLAPVLNDGYKIDLGADGYVFEFAPAGATRTFVVFVGGDVEREGFFELPVGVAYGDLFALSGFRDAAGYDLEEKIYPYYTAVTLPVDNSVIWPVGNATLLSGNCCNINYAGFDDLRFYVGDAAAHIIADYIAKNGPTNDKYDLLNIFSQAEFDLIKNRIYALRR